MSDFLLLDDDGAHSLLENPTPAYSNMTVRRAFIVWLHCGQLNEFKYVCNYFHQLEKLEKQQLPQLRVKSRIHEFNLLSSKPPKSQFLMKSFPKLYSQSKRNKVNFYKLEDMSFEDCVFTLEGFHDLKIHKGVTNTDVLKTSEMIRKYCKEHSQSLKFLLSQYQDFNKKCRLENSLNNISVYIKKRFMKDELMMYHNLPKHFSFLDDDGDEDISVKRVGAANAGTTAVIRPNKTLAVINDPRKQDFMNLLCNMPRSPTANCASPQHWKSTPVSSKFIKGDKDPSRNFI